MDINADGRRLEVREMADRMLRINLIFDVRMKPDETVREARNRFSEKLFDTICKGNENEFEFLITDQKVKGNTIGLVI